MFLVGFVLFDLQFYVYVLQIVVCPFVLFFILSLCCLSFDLRIMITSLVSSNSSYRGRNILIYMRPTIYFQTFFIILSDTIHKMYTQLSFIVFYSIYIYNLIRYFYYMQFMICDTRVQQGTRNLLIMKMYSMCMLLKI